MKVENFQDFVSSLQVKLPEFEKFINIGDMTALFQDKPNKRFIQLNYERGLLLYALISKFKPKNVLEIGTASGYGTLCMAWAMADNKIDGKIFTVDPIPITENTERILDDHTEKGPRVEQISVKEIWTKIAKQDWIKKIIPLCGYSGEIMKECDFPKFDFAYVDGAHFFDAVKHDFYSIISQVNNEFGILFDDYVNRPYYGIKKLIDEEVSKNFDASLIKTDTQDHLAEMLSLTDPVYGMCWIHSSSLKKPLNEIYPKSERDEFIVKYLKFENRLKKRNLINKRFPFMRNIRFQFWK